MRLLDHIEVGAKVVLLVLFLESLEIAEVRMNPNQDLEQASRLRRAPSLLSEDDLVAAAHARGGFDLKQRLMAARPDRVRKLCDQVD
ncbi:MAG TPA: hypothetical protein VN970_08910 [Thermoanaerobaculia bacterium]|jgi:hypothetical protein|nr:hypothetical protein [Thermoanaerobaculia bacterium]